MAEYDFSLIVAVEPMSHDQILDATDALGEAGCTDALIRGHPTGMELLFSRDADSLEAAISSAIAAVESVGYCVVRVEMERVAMPS